MDMCWHEETSNSREADGARVCVDTQTSSCSVYVCIEYKSRYCVSMHEDGFVVEGREADILSLCTKSK